MAVLEKYRLEARLGGGGMAEVFIGSKVGADGFARRVAIKRVLPGYSNNATFAQMFVAEAKLSGQLAHPNIVSVIDFDRDAEQRLFLVMELVEGRDLHALNATGLLPYPVVVYIIAEVLRGLDHAHNARIGGKVKGVVHRDVSPHNILLSWEGDVKVSDFGLAKARDASQVTATDFVKGKPSYMSPEQANGQSLDGRSDLFAVGVMFWEMLTGKRLFSADDTRAMLAAVLFGKIPRPRQLRADVPKDLERVVMKLLERNVSDRPRTAATALDDLLSSGAVVGGREALMATLAERFAHEKPVRWNPPIVTSSASLAASRSEELRTRRQRRTWRRVFGVTSTAAIAAAAILAVVFARGRSAPISAEPPADDIAIVGDKVLAGMSTAFVEKLGPSCTAYLRETDRFSKCAKVTPDDRAAFLETAARFRRALAKIETDEPATDRPHLRAVWEKSCKVALDERRSRAPDC